VKSKPKKRFAIRTVKNGVVRINGVDFFPNKRDPYNGELDGKRFAFSLYYNHEGWNPEFVHLWGSEKMYHDCEATFDNEPNVINGTFYWDWWYSAQEVSA
jgi:hypothetical protein